MKTEVRSIEFSETVDLEEVEPGYLLGSMSILGILHHVELIAVADHDETGFQQGIDIDEYGSNYQRIEDLLTFTEGEPMQTVEIDGKDYVCVIHPFAR